MHTRQAHSRKVRKVPIAKAAPDRVAIGRRIRAIAAVFRRPAELKGIDRASGQMVWDLDLSHTELYGTPTGRIASAGIANEPARKRDACQEPATVTQAYLPIGPSCC